MSLYISALNLPPKGKIKMLVLFDDGIVLDDADGQNQWQAIEVPPHGRLIDADAFFGECPELAMYEQIAETIIPADKNENRTD